AAGQPGPHIAPPIPTDEDVSPAAVTPQIGCRRAHYRMVVEEDRGCLRGGCPQPDVAHCAEHSVELDRFQLRTAVWAVEPIEDVDGQEVLPPDDWVQL